MNLQSLSTPQCCIRRARRTAVVPARWEYDYQSGRRYRATLARALHRHLPPCLLAASWWALLAWSALLLPRKLRPIRLRTSLMIVQVFAACLGRCRVANPVGRVVARTTEFFSEIGVSEIQGGIVSPVVPKALPLHRHCHRRGKPTFVSTAGVADGAGDLRCLARRSISARRRTTASEACDSFSAPRGTEAAFSRSRPMVMDISE